MILLVGLGNPDSKYHYTRHNTGYLLVDFLKKSLPKNSRIILQKTNRYMNQSGSAVQEFLSAHKIMLENLYIAYDDLDIKFGKYKIIWGKSPKEHRGINSVIQLLGTINFWHIRIGIENRTLLDEPVGEEYVLSEFSEQEKKILTSVVFPQIKEQLNNRFFKK